MKQHNTQGQAHAEMAKLRHSILEECDAQRREAREDLGQLKLDMRAEVCTTITLVCVVCVCAICLQ